MKKKISIYFILFCVFLCAGSVHGQVPPSLAGQLEEAIKKQFPEWKPIKQGQFFVNDTFDQKRIIANLTDCESRLHILINVQQTQAEMDNLFRLAFMRQIIPLNSALKNVGDKAHLFETANWVQIVMAKENIYVSLTYTFPTAKNKKTSIYSNAPQIEKNKIIKYACVIADAIGDK